MARSIVPLFSTNLNTFTLAHTTGEGTTITGVLIRNDYPPSELGSGSIYVEVTGVSPVATITVTCQLLFSRNNDTQYWGESHQVKDDNDSATFNTLSDLKFEANLFTQDWWKENNGFRIILTFDNDRTTTIFGSAVIR